MFAVPITGGVVCTHCRDLPNVGPVTARYNNPVHGCTRHRAARERMIAAVTITIHAIELVAICVLVLLALLVVTWRRI